MTSAKQRFASKMASFDSDLASRLEAATESAAGTAPQAEPIVTGLARTLDIRERLTALEVELAEARKSGAIVELPLNLLDDNPEQIDTTYDNDYIAQLADAWRAGSEPPPIEVRPVADRYIILSGHHRARAAGLAQRVAIKARVIALSDERAVDMVFISNNVKRRTDWSNACFFSRRLDDKKADGKRRFDSQATLARFFGVDPGLLSKLLSMRKLPEEIQTLLMKSPGLFNATTAADVILPALREHPNRLGDIVKCIERLATGTPQSALKGLLQQTLNRKVGRTPAAPSKTFGSRRAGFTRTTSVNARKLTISIGADADLDAVQREIDSVLARLANGS